MLSVAFSPRVLHKFNKLLPPSALKNEVNGTNGDEDPGNNETIVGLVRERALQRSPKIRWCYVEGTVRLESGVRCYETSERLESVGSIIEFYQWLPIVNKHQRRYSNDAKLGIETERKINMPLKWAIKINRKSELWFH